MQKYCFLHKFYHFCISKADISSDMGNISLPNPCCPTLSITPILTPWRYIPHASRWRVCIHLQAIDRLTYSCCRRPRLSLQRVQRLRPGPELASCSQTRLPQERRIRGLRSVPMNFDWPRFCLRPSAKDQRIFLSCSWCSPFGSFKWNFNWKSKIFGRSWDGTSEL